ncbi:MAG TPA: tetratricopeptide repeat protein, partial [Roseiarcus sp.]|nr:tetratricopeptide repeat protein [Roseiarcus sp.]
MFFRRSGASLCRRGNALYERRQFLAAFRCWRDAETRGDAEASFRVAMLYERGEGVMRSLPDALEWHKKAALRGHAEAQYRLGFLYLSGFAAAPSGAESWLRAAGDFSRGNLRNSVSALFPNGVAVE